ncbi:oxygen-dependent tRNA uridine(34) hydroxylase TrhO [Martelella alba]|uniref:tRNA uridine(34) hydroxylase n=1 Tax=Martelella alba TaxID=2590451 RepID=A0ABY2SNT9_9HYPH|nr:rhodanese-related sulfurtransferase [Martelella alba]TKI07687.1 rhodanese-related sulfurtransferase [Martelella alba]
MPVLHNRVANDELRRRMLAESEPRVTLSFYKYFHLADPQAFRDQLYQGLAALHVFGRIYVAGEGINGQASVPQSRLEALRRLLYAAHPALDPLRLNIALDDDGKSFWVLRMKVRDRLVADGISDPTFDPASTGDYLDAEQVNAMAGDPDTLFVDMRNHYEYEVGHFDNAIEIPSDTFREQLPMAAKMLADAKDKPIVMYCTGGIRCEKASAYLRHHGFKRVYHIEGGIIEYVRRAKEQGLPLKFTGKNFVFDARLGERVTPDIIARCHQCGQPCDTHVNCRNQGCHLLFIQCRACAEKYQGCCSPACQEEKDLPLKAQRARRAGRERVGNIFNKSRRCVANQTMPVINDAPEEK